MLNVPEELTVLLNNFSELFEYNPNDRFGYIEYSDNEGGKCWNYLFEVCHKVFGDGFEMFHGASKAVIVLNDYDIVIKIPFNCFSYDSGSWLFEEDPSAEITDDKLLNMEPFFSEATYFFSENGNIINTEYGWDYCFSESTVYEVAEDYGFEDFFAETTLFCNAKNNYPIYIQKKCITYYDYIDENETDKKVSKEDLTEVRKSISSKTKNEYSTDSFPIFFIYSLVQKYGETKTAEFLDFVCENGFDRDMHTDNFGFSLDGSPVLIDYSGFDS